MKNKINSIKRHFSCNKNAYIVGMITVPIIILQHQGIKSLNKFLDEKGIAAEYYLYMGEE